MKWITRDTVWALMQPTPQKRSEALKKCGYTDEDIKDADSMYNALYDVSFCDLPYSPIIPSQSTTLKVGDLVLLNNNYFVWEIIEVNTAGYRIKNVAVEDNTSTCTYTDRDILRKVGVSHP
jgi:hypothetical protein